MVLWCYDAMVLWCYGAMVLWRYGVIAAAAVGLFFIAGMLWVAYGSYWCVEGVDDKGIGNFQTSPICYAEIL